MTPRIGQAPNPIRVGPSRAGLPPAWTLEVRWLIGDGADARELVWVVRRSAGIAQARAELRGPGAVVRELGPVMPVDVTADESGPTILLHADGPGLSLSVEIGATGSARTLYARTDALGRLGIAGGRYDLGPATWRDETT